MSVSDDYIKKYFKKGNRIMKSYLKKANDEILCYLTNRYSDSESLVETLYRIFNNVDVHPKCKICGKPVKFLGMQRGFSVVCKSKKCLSEFKRQNSSFNNIETQKKVKQNIYEKYGVNNPYQIDNIKNKAKTNAHSEITNNKRINTCIEKYGVDNPAKADPIKQKISDTLSNFSDDKKKEIYEKHKKTFIERYGVEWYSKLDSHKENISKLIASTECLTKRKNTCLHKYGDATFNNQELRNKTMKTNNSFKSSKTEDIVYELLKTKFVDVIREYSSDLYKFKCDFYIPAIDTYIEFQGSHYHHNHPFDESNENDQNELENLKQLTEHSKRHDLGKKSQYDNIIYTWTDLDVRKRRLASENNINFIELWSLDDAYDWIENTLFYYVDEDILKNEFEYYKNTSGRLSAYSQRNEIVKFFQQNEFFKTEKNLWKDKQIQDKLIENRMKYLDKKPNELSDNDMLVGFKKSGIHYSYSHFNPLIFKWFIEKFNVKRCYDPCGGWGHRLLGATGLEQYIYNDISTNVKRNVKIIADYFNLRNVIFYNEDAKVCCPENDNLEFDSIFTCPPYGDIEDYGFNITKNDVNEIVDSIISKYSKNNFIHTVGIVIREDFMNDDTYDEKIEIKSRKSAHLMKNKEKHFKEYLYVWHKKTILTA